MSAEGGLVGAAGGPAGQPGRRRSLAGAAFGFFFVLLDRTSDDAGLTPLVAARLASVALVVVVALAGQAVAAGDPAGPAAGRSRPGVGDMTANALFLLATQQDGPAGDHRRPRLALPGQHGGAGAGGAARAAGAGAQVAGLGAAVAAVVLITLPG